MIKNQDGDIIVGKIGNNLFELSKEVPEGSEITYITTKETVGHQVYERTAIMIMLSAIFNLGGKELVSKAVIHFSMGNGIFITMKDFLITDEFVVKVKSEMEKIVKEDIVIKKENVSTKKAIEKFNKHKMYDKELLFKFRRSSRVNLYSIGNYQDYFYGYMAKSTGIIKYFNIEKYDNGMMLILPNRKEPCKINVLEENRRVFTIQRETRNWNSSLNIGTVGALNELITKEGGKNITLISEASLEQQISSVARDISKNNKIKFIMVAGPSSSGKTSFANRLAIQLFANGKIPHIISIDNYFVNRENTPKDEEGKFDFESLEAIDVKKFNEDMKELLKGNEIQMPTFNFVSGQREYRGDTLKLEESHMLIIEGIHGLNEKLSSTLPRENKVKIYISALTQLNIDSHNRIPTTDGRLIRRIVRDARVRGTSAKDTIGMWQSVRRGEEKHIFPYQEEADYIINSALLYELSCLKVYAEPLLFGIDSSCPEYIEAKRLLKFLDYFLPIPSEYVPNNSIIREFIGGSMFNV